MAFLRVVKLSLLCCCLSFSGFALAQQESIDYENELLEIVETIQQGKLDGALSLASDHLHRYPQSRVGHLLKADILMAMSAGLTSIGAIKLTHSLSIQAKPLQAQAIKTKALQGLKHQIKNRWNHSKSETRLTDTHVPASLVDMGRHKYALVADMTDGRLYLYANEQGQPNLIRDYYLTVGAAGFGKQVEGDNKTPVGVYSIYKHISQEELPDLYGSGAFPVNYPNRFDRFKQRTGYGIWLHGTPSDTYARSPLASEGCFVISNVDLQDIRQFIDVEKKPPVILTDSIEWLSKEQFQHRRAQYLDIFSQWKSDWESLNTQAYLNHYSTENFNLGKGKFNQWSQSKHRTNSKKTFIQLDLEIDSLFLYPGEKDMFIVKYKQRYLSNNYHGEVNKEQYWQRDDNGQWKIIYEG